MYSSKDPQKYRILPRMITQGTHQLIPFLGDTVQLSLRLWRPRALGTKGKKNAPPQTRKEPESNHFEPLDLPRFPLRARFSTARANEAAVAGWARRREGHEAALISRRALGELGRRREVATDVGPRRQRIPGAGGGGRWRSGDRWERSHGGEKLIAE